MRIRVLASTIAAVALCFFASPARAQTASATVCTDGTTSSAVGKDICVGHGGVKAKATSSVHSSVTCVDGTVSTTGREVCDKHGGVKSTSSTTRTSTISRKSGRPDDKDSTKAIALCKDGLYSHATTRAAACKERGGVARYLHR